MAGCATRHHLQCERQKIYVESKKHGCESTAQKQQHMFVFAFCILVHWESFYLSRYFRPPANLHVLSPHEKRYGLGKLPRLFFNFLGYDCSDYMICVFFWISIKSFCKFEKHPNGFGTAAIPAIRSHDNSVDQHYISHTFLQHP